MKLKEKICLCRKKAGLSQEALAEQIGVSRQAVSKWETGDAEPELGKLRLLAQVLDVSADYLLSEEAPCEQPPKETPSTASDGDWADALPGAIGKLARRYGWLAGVYLAVGGFCFAGLGALARLLTRSMFSNFMGGFDSVITPGSGDAFLADFAAHNPVSLMGTVLIVVGLLVGVAGIVLAVLLKKKSQE